MRTNIDIDDELMELRGKVKWEGDLATMREGRFLDWEEGSEREKRKDPAA
jgi:hypothetical protein